jgi:hypothetical protein
MSQQDSVCVRNFGLSATFHLFEWAHKPAAAYQAEDKTALADKSAMVEARNIPEVAAPQVLLLHVAGDNNISVPYKHAG